MEEYKKSHIEIKLTFDKVREQDFKMILNEQFKIKAKLSKYFDDSANKQDQLERDFGNRETELQVFRRLSQNAINAPLLTKAMVKKVRKCIDSFDEVNISLIIEISVEVISKSEFRKKSLKFYLRIYPTQAPVKLTHLF